MPKKKESINRYEEKIDTVLLRIARSKWSGVIVGLYSLVWYLVGHYMGDVIHWFGQIL